VQLTVTGRHVEVTEALRRYIDNRVRRLERYGLKLDEAQVVLGVEKYRHTAEIILTLNGAVIQGKESTTEMYASIDRVFDQMRRRVRKRKEILSDHKPRSFSRKAPQAGPGPAMPRSPIRTVRMPLPTLTVEDAVGRVPLPPSSILVFLNPSTERVQVLRRLADGDIELVDPEPA